MDRQIAALENIANDADPLIKEKLLETVRQMKLELAMKPKTAKVAPSKYIETLTPNEINEMSELIEMYESMPYEFYTQQAKPVELKPIETKLVKSVRPKIVRTDKLPNMTKVKEHEMFKTFKANFFHVGDARKDYRAVIEHVGKQTKQVLKELIKKNGVKFRSTIACCFYKTNDTDVPDYCTKLISSKQEVVVTNFEDLDPEVNDALEEIERDIDEFCVNGSGWSFEEAKWAELETTDYVPLHGSSFIKTPEYVPARSVLNVQNKEDNACFKWAILSALYQPDDHPERVNKYKQHEDKLNFKGITFPTPTTQFKKFEKQNPDVSLCVYAFDYNRNKNELIPCPLYVSDRMNFIEKKYREVDLLLITEKDNSHYVWIKNFNTFCTKFNKYMHKKYPCRRCLKVMSAKHVYEQHLKLCQGINKGAQTIEMPNEGDVVECKDYGNKMKVPFVIYADFECFNIKTGANFDNACGDPECDLCSNEKKDTIQTSKQEANSYCYIVVRSDGQIRGPYLYRGHNAVQHFLMCMSNEVKLIQNIFDNPAPLVATNEINKQRDEATICWACDKIFQPKDIKVRHHDHITGEFVGICHDHCNLQMRVSRTHTKIPVVFHNLRGYDSHLILAATDSWKKYPNLKNVSCIPNNMEKYMSFSLGPLRFIDSFQFMPESLDSLVKAMNPSELKILRNNVEYIFDDKTDNQDKLFDMIRRKGVYPYEYVDTFERFNEDKLPPIDEFYSSLTRSSIEQKEYEHAQEVWKMFECKDFGKYHDIYLKTDVLLLADVFEKFRQMGLDYYKLDPAHYLTAPGFSWAAMLRMTNIKLELLTDEDMHMFIEKGIRGGISTVATKRHVKANNKYCMDHDKTKPDNFIMYYDANALYSTAMSKKLPTGGFNWIDLDLEQASKLIMETTFDSDKERYYEVDLHYPPELHDAHNDYPLAPETLVIDKKYYSEYQKDVAAQIGKQFFDNVKLVPNLRDKKEYVIHGQTLKLYLQLGLKLTKIHRVLEFDQSDWLNTYISFNIDKRSKTSVKFESNFFKLLNNSVYGKTMENLRKRMRVELVLASNTKKLYKLTSQPFYIGRRELSPGLYAIHMQKTKLILNRPIYIGLAVLDISKWIMYDFWYNHIKASYGDNAELINTNTDSLILNFKATTEIPDIYEHIKANKDYYDFSEYPKTHPCYDKTNAKVMGKFKDESQGRPITEIIAISSKMYAYTRDPLECDNKDFYGTSKRAKGVTKTVTTNDLTFETYKRCLENREVFKNKQTAIRSKNQKIGVYDMNKVSLSDIYSG